MPRPSLAQIKKLGEALRANRIRLAGYVKAVEDAIEARDAVAHFNAVNALRAAELPPMEPMTQAQYDGWHMKVK